MGDKAYEAPEWGGIEGMEGYSIDVIKGGSVIEVIDLSKKGSFVFGTFVNKR